MFKELETKLTKINAEIKTNIEEIDAKIAETKAKDDAISKELIKAADDLDADRYNKAIKKKEETAQTLKLFEQKADEKKKKYHLSESQAFSYEKKVTKIQKEETKKVLAKLVEIEAELMELQEEKNTLNKSVSNMEHLIHKAQGTKYYGSGYRDRIDDFIEESLKEIKSIKYRYK